MNFEERIKLVGELASLVATVKAKPDEKVAKIGRIIAIIKMLGETVGDEKNATGLFGEGDFKITSDEELAKAWKDFLNGDYGPTGGNALLGGPGAKLRRDMLQKFRKAGNEYLQKAHPTLLVTLTGVNSRIYQYQGRGKWQWWQVDERDDDLDPLYSGTDEDGNAILRDFVSDKIGTLEGEVKDITLHGNPTREDFYQNGDEYPEWENDRETLRLIIKGKHPDMRSPILYETIAAIDKRQKTNCEYPEILEIALDSWQAVVLDITSKIVE